MSILNQKIEKRNKENNTGTSMLFLVGAIFGGFGAYLFLTGKGASFLKTARGKSGSSSDNQVGRRTLIEERLSAVHPDNIGAIAKSKEDDEPIEPTLKAQKMVSDLRHNKGSDPIV